MLSTGYKLWPMVCLLNLVIVPFEYRMLVGNSAAFCWGIYMSLCPL
jgi:protein Mpv17